MSTRVQFPDATAQSHQATDARPAALDAAAGDETVARAVVAFAEGKPVVLVDDGEPGAEGYLVFAAELASSELLAFAIRHSAGYICVALSEGVADRLQIPPMCYSSQDRRRLDYGVTVDASTGISTGISAVDRAHTIRLLAGQGTLASDFTRPGHVVPLRAKSGGVLMRPSPAEAIVDLAAMAGLRPLGALAQMVSETNQVEMARGEELGYFADRHRLTVLSIADLVAYRWRHEKLVYRVAEARVPLPVGTFTAVGYTVSVEERSHVALVHGDVAGQCDVSVYLHFECLPGDVFGSTNCTCRPQLHTALDVIAAEGRGAVLYLRGTAAAGDRLLDHLRQDVEAAAIQTALCHRHAGEGDDYRSAAQILNDIGIRSARLLTNDPKARAALEGCAVTVTRQTRVVGPQIAQHPESRYPSLDLTVTARRQGR